MLITDLKRAELSDDQKFLKIAIIQNGRRSNKPIMRNLKCKAIQAIKVTNLTNSDMENSFQALFQTYLYILVLKFELDAAQSHKNV